MKKWNIFNSKNEFEFQYSDTDLYVVTVILLQKYIIAMKLLMFQKRKIQNVSNEVC